MVFKVKVNGKEVKNPTDYSVGFRNNTIEGKLLSGRKKTKVLGTKVVLSLAYELIDDVNLRILLGETVGLTLSNNTIERQVTYINPLDGLEVTKTMCYEVSDVGLDNIVFKNGFWNGFSINFIEV